MDGYEQSKIKMLYTETFIHTADQLVKEVEVTFCPGFVQQRWRSLI